jgi:hypothetical protein
MNKKSDPEPVKSKEYNRFEQLARKLLKVPKKDLPPKTPKENKKPSVKG